MLPFADDSPVLTWRFPEYGGDSSAAQGRQSNIHNIHSSRAAFAAVADEGSVVSAHPSVRVCMCYFAWRWICCDLERSTPLQRRQKFFAHFMECLPPQVSLATAWCGAAEEPSRGVQSRPWTVAQTDSAKSHAWKQNALKPVVDFNPELK